MHHDIDREIKAEERKKALKALYHIVAFILFARWAFNPISHRLLPDIGTDERAGTLVGFHYERRTWWGFRKQTFDDIRFQKDQGPQYLDGAEWKDVPDEAWKPAELDDRQMETDNRGAHEVN